MESQPLAPYIKVPVKAFWVILKKSNFDTYAWI